MTAEEFLCNHFGCGREFLIYNITQKPYDVVKAIEALQKQVESITKLWKDQKANSEYWNGELQSNTEKPLLKKIEALQKEVEELKDGIRRHCNEAVADHIINKHNIDK